MGLVQSIHEPNVPGIAGSQRLPGITMHQLAAILGSIFFALWAVILFKVLQTKRKNDGR